MVETVVDPASDDTLDLREVQHHAQIVKLCRFDRNQKSPIVTMQVPAFPVVAEKSMAVAEIDLTTDLVHKIPLGWPLNRVGATQLRRKRYGCEYFPGSIPSL